MLGGEALPTALAGELRDAPARPLHEHVRADRDDDLVAHPRDRRRTRARPIPIGTPIANTTIYVLDADGRRVPVGVFGELHIGGDGVARGYHDRPELTAERFVERPGMGRRVRHRRPRADPSDGVVEFAGRADNQVKIRGHRIELGEIEAVLDRHPDVVQSVVVARDDARRHPARRVRRACTTGPTATSDALRKHVAETLPEAMVPSVVVRLDAFPLTPNGKIDRKALPADGRVVGADVDSVADRAAGRRHRAARRRHLERACSSAPVGRDDNFFDIGGHSLLAVKVFRRLADATAAPLALTDIFRFPTVRTFAAHLGAGRGDGAGRRQRRRPRRPRRPAPTAARCAGGRWPAVAGARTGDR